MKTYTDNFNSFGVVAMAANTMNGKEIGIMLRHDDSSESTIIIPNENAVKLAKWILEVLA